MCKAGIGRTQRMSENAQDQKLLEQPQQPPKTTHELIKEILDQKFIYNEDFARIFALAIEGGKNAIIYGLGGHGKSEMTSAIIKGLGFEDDTFVQFFGEGMDETRIYGGINFAKFNNDSVLEYQPERSFLDSQIAIFEELFDAPASVLLALKDTLTAGAMRNGAQQHPMSTNCIICLTNKTPKEVADLGPSAAALVERFPLQLELKWPHYTERDYAMLFQKVGCKEADPSDIIDVLSGVCRQCTEEGDFVSPRTAVQALNICGTAAKMRGSAKIGFEDLGDLKYIPGMEGRTAEIMERVQRERVIREQEEKLDEFEARFRSLNEMASSTNDSNECLAICKKAKDLLNETRGIALHDDLVCRRDEMREGLNNIVNYTKDKAVELCG